MMPSESPIRRRKDVSEKLKDQLKLLQYCGWPNEIYRKYQNEINENDPHTEIYKTEKGKVRIYHAFKEVLISYYTGIAINAIRAIRKRVPEISEKTCFVDATAGIGIIPLLMEDKVIPIFGSAVIPFIAPTLGERYFGRKELKPFKMVFLMEKDRQRRNILRKIIDEVSERLRNINMPVSHIEYYDDFNSYINRILMKYRNECNYWLVVIDPTGAEIEWNAMETLLNAREKYKVIVDVMFNFMCGSLRRQKGEACSKKHIFDEFFGDEGWRKCCNEEEFGECLHNYYVDKVKSLNYEVYGSSIWKMGNPWHYHFDLIVYKRKEKEKPHPWVQPYNIVSKYIDKLGEEGLYQMLRHQLLTNKDNDKDKSLPGCPAKK
jgi:hypothetical protein